MDLLAILLLILPAIFKLIKNNEKNHKRIENKEYDISGWLSKFRNEIDNLFERKDENGFDEENIILKDVKAAEQIKYDNETREPSKEKKIQTAQPLNTNQKAAKNTNELPSNEAEVSYRDMNLDFSNEDIMKSIIISEILNKPVSKRGAR